MIVVLKMNADTVWEEYFNQYHSQILPFRDASYGDCTYECTIYHCLKGLEFATRLGWYSFRDFDPKEYEYYEKVENGDLNWVIPGKFIAFMGPIERLHGVAVNPDQRHYGNSPEDYIEVFRHFGVTHVVRLNEPGKYDRQKFVKNGVKHTELYFIDGSTPSEVKYNLLILILSKS